MTQLAGCTYSTIDISSRNNSTEQQILTGREGGPSSEKLYYSHHMTKSQRFDHSVQKHTKMFGIGAVHTLRNQQK